MTIQTNAPASVQKSQFALISLFEYTTICAILLANSTLIGLAASVPLMLMAMAIWARQGWLALGLLAAASLTADVWADPFQMASVPRQLLVMLPAALVVAWYR